MAGQIWWIVLNPLPIKQAGARRVEDNRVPVSLLEFKFGRPPINAFSQFKIATENILTYQFSNESGPRKPGLCRRRWSGRLEPPFRRHEQRGG